MALATVADVEQHLGRQLSVSEAARAEVRLRGASAAVVGYCNQDFLAEPAPPETVVDVVAGMVARQFEQGDQGIPLGLSQAQVGPYSGSFSPATVSGDAWLTAADRLKLRPYRSAVTSIGARSDRRTQWDAP